MKFETLLWDLEDRILTLRLNRPDHLNAFTVRMGEELVEAFARASEDDAVGAVIVTGEGRAFCAGMDLNVQGNAFGLDESQTPDLADMRRDLGPPASTPTSRADIRLAGLTRRLSPPMIRN